MTKLNRRSTQAEKISALGLGIFRTLCAVLLLLGAGLGSARIPEPPNIYYGSVSLDGVPLTAAHTQATVSLAINGAVIGSYPMGSNPAAGNTYVLTVPLDAIEPRTPSTARPGDTGTITLAVNGTQYLAQVVTIGERGTVTQLNLSGTGIETDTDGDGIPNATDPDDDNDGVPDVGDNAPLDATNKGPVIAVPLNSVQSAQHG